MDKKEFLSSINYEDKTLLSKVYDKIILTQKSGKTTHTTEFYPPNVWRKIEQMSFRLEIKITSYGIFEDAERRIISFQQSEPYEYPVRLLAINNKSKFSLLEHKDYLGAIMSLGIKREKFGDLIVFGGSCYAAVYEDIFDYIRDNLLSIGKCPCSNNEILDAGELPKVSFEEKVVIAASYRLDSIIGALSGLSRSKAVELISSGKVLLDYEVATEKDLTVHNGSVLTIRGWGKYKLEEQIGNSGSGRLKLLVKKYI